jgi:hypothetical protein
VQQQAHLSGDDVGGLDLTDYCRDKGFDRASFPGDVGEVGDWQCVRDDGSSMGFNKTYNSRWERLRTLSWEEACENRYGIEHGEVRAVNTNWWDDPNGVRCVTE